MKALVTGATGFIGGALSRRLASDGHDVVGIGRDEERGAALASDGVAFVRRDFTEPGALDALCEDVDVVFHSGARCGPWGSRKAFWQANVLGTQHVIQSCEKQGVTRIVFVSSPSVTNRYAHRTGIRETDPLPPNPVNDYSASKLAAEAIVQRASTRSVIIRPRAVFGPGDRTIFPRLLRALARRRLPIIGSGDNEIDLTYIDNVVDALLASATADVPSGRVYHVTNGEPVRVWDLLAEVAERLDLPPLRRRIPVWVARGVARSLEAGHRAVRADKEPLLTEYSVGLLAYTATFDICRAQDELGYAPKVSIRQGMEIFLRHWEATP